MYAVSDALLISLLDDPLFEITVPGKLSSYLASGRPLLAAVKGDAAAMIREARAGLTVSPSVPADLARGVRELRAMSPENRKRMGDGGRSYYVQNLAPSVLVDQYDQLFRRVRAAAGSGRRERSP
ncbi:MAG: hypothetical protein HY238_19545 [Acidobacteria bacterium]|nr:hypothetical protein [Acidobacteriota bacterium]